MNVTTKFAVAGALALGLGLLGSTTTLAGSGYVSVGGRFGGGSAGYRGGSYGGYHGGYYGGYHGGYYGHGGYHDSFFFGFPLGFSFSYYDAPYYSGYYPAYSYYPAPAYYAPSVVYSAPPAPAPAAVVYNTPTDSRVVYGGPSPEQTMLEHANTSQAPAVPAAEQPAPLNRGGAMNVADVKVLAKSGVGDAVIVSQIRNSGAVFHLSTAEIVELKNSGVSEKVIDCMINTASAPRG